MGIRRKDGNHIPQKNNSIQDSLGNEGNGYPVTDPNRTMMTITKESNIAHKRTLKEELLEEITEKLMENILDMVNKNVQDALKKFQDTKNKEHEKIQKQINKLREDFNKHQSETKTA
jgi:uncharacterized protein (UPF0305 family)